MALLINQNQLLCMSEMQLNRSLYDVILKILLLMETLKVRFFLLKVFNKTLTFQKHFKNRRGLLSHHRK